EFINSSSQLSTHYMVGLDGTLDCFVDPGDRAWGNGILEPGNRWATIALDCGADPALNPNHITIVCETEDRGDATQTVTDLQFKGVVIAARQAKRRYPDSLHYLACHADISPQSRPQCPGDRWTKSGRFAELAAMVGLKTVTV